MGERSFMDTHVPSVSEQLRVLEVEENRRGSLDLDLIPDDKLWDRPPYTRNDDEVFEAMLGAKLVQYAKLLVRPAALVRTIRGDLVGATKNKTKELVLRGLVRAQEGISGERMTPDPLDPERLSHLFNNDEEAESMPIRDTRSWDARVNDDKLPEGVIAFNAGVAARRLRRLFETTKTAEEMATAAAKAFDEKTLKSIVIIWGTWRWSSQVFGWRARTSDENKRVQEAYWLIRKSFDLSTDMTRYDLAHNFLSDEIVEAQLKPLFGCLDPAHGETKEREVTLWDNGTVTVGDKVWSRVAFVNEFYVGADGRYEAPLDTNDGWRLQLSGRRRVDINQPLPSPDEYVSISVETYKGVVDAIGQLPNDAPEGDDIASPAGYGDILDDDDDVSAE